MFESFNVPGLLIAVQAVLALSASWQDKPIDSRSLTGLVSFFQKKKSKTCKKISANFSNFSPKLIFTKKINLGN